MRRKRRGVGVWWWCLVFWAGWLGWVWGDPVRDLAGLVTRVTENRQWAGDWVLEGKVCAVSQGGRRVALMDRSGTMWLECEDWGVKAEPGMEWRLSGERCVVSRDEDRLVFGTAPVVEMDGHHGALTGIGSVYLEEGWNAFRLEWFNGVVDAVLEVEWQPPGMDWQALPESVLGHWEGIEVKGGLEYAVYEGAWWHRLPDFRFLEPVKRGVVGRPDIGVRTRPERVAVVYDGLLRARRGGWYSFRVTSDDGVRLKAAGVKAKVEVLGRGEVPVPQKEDLVAMGGVGHWMTREGRVAFAGWREGVMELEVSGTKSPLVVHWWGGRRMKPEEMLNRRVIVTGVGRRGEDLVAGGGGVQLMDEADESSEEVTEIGEIRQMSREEAGRGLSAKLRGVVTMSGAGFLVLQDATGGVYISYEGLNVSMLPKPREIWEVKGRTDPGEFSPMIYAESLRCVGMGSLPVAAVPSWEQLLSGSPDAEMVEVEGVVDEVNKSEIHLLMRDGRMRVVNGRFHPLPLGRWDDESVSELKGSVVKIRGVYGASWDLKSGQVHGGVCRLGNAVMSIEKPAPEDWFDAPRMKARELFLFRSQSTKFRRVMVEGVVLGVRGREILLDDEGQGFRAIVDGAEGLAVGDRVEVAGYPRMGGVATVSLDGRVRRIGRGVLPEPVRLAEDQVPNKKWDAKWVMLDAVVRSDIRRDRERVLDLQSGEHRWVARLSTAEDGGALVERGSEVRLCGVYLMVPSERTGGEVFEVVMKGAEDLEVLRRGPWWTTKHTLWLVSGLVGALVLAAGWVMLLRRTVALRGRQLAAEIEEREESERHRVMERERSRVAQDLHDELGSGLTEVGMLTALAKNPGVPMEKKAGYLEKLEEVSRELVTVLDEIVWAVNPRYDSVGDLAGYFSLYAQRFLGLAGIRCRLMIEETVGFYPLDARQRHGVFLAFKEALNNLVKHSGAVEAFLRISVIDEWLKVEVRDEGKGMAALMDGEAGEGLRGMTRRMEELGGRCVVDGPDGRGTRVRLELPLNEPLRLS